MRAKINQLAETPSFVGEQTDKRCKSYRQRYPDLFKMLRKFRQAFDLLFCRNIGYTSSNTFEMSPRPVRQRGSCSAALDDLLLMLCEDWLDTAFQKNSLDIN